MGMRLRIFIVGLGEVLRATTRICCMAVCTWLGMMAWDDGEQWTLVLFSFKNSYKVKSAFTHDLRGYISDYGPE